MLHTSAKKFMKSFGILSILFLISTLLINYSIYNSYKNILYQNYLSVVSSTLENHPELEEEIMVALINPRATNTGKIALKKYGLDDVNAYHYIDKVKLLRRDMLVKTIFINIIFIILFVLLYVFYKRKEYNKISEIEDYFNKILRGDYSIDIREYSESDYSCLKNDIYKVTNLLKEKENYSNREKIYLESVLSDISHQLRTPLTSMYVINDILENDDIDYERKREMLSKNRKQLERIEWLVTSLLKLSRLDSGMVTLKKDKVPIFKLIEEAILPLRIPIELKEQQIIIDGDKTLTLMVDEKWTIEAFVNIIKNAYEHTPKKGMITISYTDNPIYTEIRIQDTGEGISKKDLPHIFERFYHGDTNKDSIGIGLNMALSIVQKQNGCIKVESKKGKGTTFVLQFYKNVL